MKNKTTIKTLKKTAERLLPRIFRRLPCVVCLFLDNKRNNKTHPHHLIRRGCNIYHKYRIQNQIPLCDDHHIFNDYISAHGKKKGFDGFLKEYLPIHYKYMTGNNHRFQKMTIYDWEKLVEELQFYADNKFEAEKLIYETDS